MLFPDKKIPEQLELGRTKLGYLLQYGLAPYYKEQLFSSLLSVTGFVPKFVSCFYEAFNHISKWKQMDVLVFYFHEEKQQVVTSYIGSHFLGHANTKETFQSIQAVHGRLDLTHNLVQVSMDGPNVNWKRVEIMKKYWEHSDPDGPDLIEIGSCGLHVLHSAYGIAQKVTDLNLDKLLGGFYSIFKLSPAQTEDYLKVNELLENRESKSVAYLFPQKFCGLRCLENGKALKRYILTSEDISFI